MTNTLGSIQPRTFAQVEFHYSSTSAHCLGCGSTISLLVNGEWAHSHRDAEGRRDPWCRPRVD